MGRTHAAFDALRSSPVHDGARRLVDDVFRRMGDTDGNFVEQFQSTGFHARLFELACYAYLEEGGWSPKRHDRPDFTVSTTGGMIAIEAVASNPRPGEDADISVNALKDYPLDVIAAKCAEEFPIRLGGPLWDKAKKNYRSLPHCQDAPVVLFIAPFHEAGSVATPDLSLGRYLYGIEQRPVVSHKGEWSIEDAVVSRAR